jgi:hypothetical protein
VPHPGDGARQALAAEHVQRFDRGPLAHVVLLHQPRDARHYVAWRQLARLDLAAQVGGDLR